ncbi:hypothetical protein AYI68_g1928 [Smittium mucronatum]|uniref:SH3 domain-containing protein n=1 Tax=Smittium mucronatum TaxID=133383 RepID=A0A1R0H417_9FUNG|nr:hypothetical protein AYI68_g1928 [Smittium mucronatum]
MRLSFYKSSTPHTKPSILNIKNSQKYFSLEKTLGSNVCPELNQYTFKVNSDLGIYGESISNSSDFDIAFRNFIRMKFPEHNRLLELRETRFKNRKKYGHNIDDLLDASRSFICYSILGYLNPNKDPSDEMVFTRKPQHTGMTDTRIEKKMLNENGGTLPICENVCHDWESATNSILDREKEFSYFYPKNKDYTQRSSLIVFLIIRAKKSKKGQGFANISGLSLFSSLSNSNSSKNLHKPESTTVPAKVISSNDFDFIDTLLLSMHRPRRVRNRYIPKLGDELSLDIGDSVKVFLVYDDGWAMGKNLSKGTEGAFPYACLVPQGEKRESKISKNSFEYRNSSTSLTPSRKREKSFENKNENTIVEFYEDKESLAIEEKFEMNIGRSMVKEKVNSSKKLIAELKTYRNSASFGSGDKFSNISKTDEFEYIDYKFLARENHNKVASQTIPDENSLSLSPLNSKENISHTKNMDLSGINGISEINYRIPSIYEYDYSASYPLYSGQSSEDLITVKKEKKKAKVSKRQRINNEDKRTVKKRFNEKDEASTSPLEKGVNENTSNSPRYEIRKSNPSTKIKKMRRSVPISGILLSNSIKNKQKIDDSYNYICNTFSTDSAILDLRLFGNYSSNYESESNKPYNPEYLKMYDSKKYKGETNGILNPGNGSNGLENEGVYLNINNNTSNPNIVKDNSSEKSRIRSYLEYLKNSNRSSKGLSRSPISNKGMSADSIYKGPGKKSLKSSPINRSLFSIFENKSESGSKNKKSEEFSRDDRLKPDLPVQSGITIQNMNDFTVASDSEARVILLSTLN